MYTQCPDCQTRFRVTATALRAAYGTVRCGRCGSLFDALQQLSDAVPAAQPAWTAPSPLPEPPSDFAPAEEDRAGSTIVIETGAGEDITLEGERISVDGLPTPDEVVVDLDATDEFEVLRIPASEFPDEQEAERELEALIERLQREFDRQVPATGTEEEFDEDTAEIPILGPPAAVAAAERGAAPPESIAVEPEPPPPAAPAPAEADDWYLRSEPTPAVTTPPEPEPEPEPEPAVEPESPAVQMPERPVRIPTEELPLTRPWRPAPVEVMPEPAAPERSPWRTLAWTVGCLLLGLVLAGQVIHHYREQLVRDPRIGMQLREAYERLGWALPPSWNLAAIELRQSGDDDRSSGRMVVRASLTNRAVFAQPQPILRLELQDRYGTVVGTRDFEPSEYLKDPSRAAQLLEPGAGTEAELLLADPGSDAVGYRLDVCLRESATLVRCAQGPG